MILNDLFSIWGFYNNSTYSNNQLDRKTETYIYFTSYCHLSHHKGFKYLDYLDKDYWGNPPAHTGSETCHASIQTDKNES